MPLIRLLVLLALCLAPCAPLLAAVDVDPFVRKDAFGDLKLSPKGDYFAATVALEDKTALVIIRRSDFKTTATFALGKNSHVSDFMWANHERVLIAIAEKFGLLDEPQPTGEIYAINADGSKPENLVGFRVTSRGAGTKIQPKKVEEVAAFLVDTLADDDDHVVISVWPFSDEPFTRAERLNIYTGRRFPLARAPVRRAHFVTDNAGVVRFAAGAGADNVRKLYHRSGVNAEWTLVNDESVTGIAEYPIGFADDNRVAYLNSEFRQGPNAIVALDTGDGSRNVVFRDARADPWQLIYRSSISDSGSGHAASSVPIGAMFADGKPRTEFFNATDQETRLYRSLEAAFEGQSIAIVSLSEDGKLALVEVWSDRNPGDFFLFHVETKKADHVVSRRDWFDPEEMASMRPIRLQARDGLDLGGFLTVPRGAEAKALPMVVLPHGGPFGIADRWGFNAEVQLLARAGYAVLQVNFRGSGGYGRAFEEAGARQWGLAMQDDVTDATRWAIAEGIADPARICIYGGSYGAFSALSGVAREPDLYRCAAGYIGVYDLPMMLKRGDIQRRRSGETYLRDWIGEGEALAATSPSNMAGQIKVPVFLAAGGQDERAPIEHSELMERRLKAADVAVETLYYKTEGHGFYVEKHRREYYTRLLDFIGRHIGPAAGR